MRKLFSILFLAGSILTVKGQSMQSNSDSLSKPRQGNNDSIEDRIIDKLFSLPEVKAKNRFIDSITLHKHGIAFITLKRPSNKNDYYWMQAGYNSDLRFESYYDFYVYYPKMKILIFDPATNSTLSLSEWRKRNRHP